MFNPLPINLNDLQPILFAVAYKMIGEVQASEDIAQETIAIYLLKVAKKQISNIENPKNYLVKTAINRSINYLKKIKKERANYYGIWLPEPIINYAETIDYQLDVNYGLTFLLSKLTPKERAVFILKHAFDFSFLDIGLAVNLKEATCRKTYQRLKEKLATNPESTKVEKEAKERFLQAFLAVGESGDLAPFISILKEDIVLYSDGGGKASAAKHPLTGLETCLKFLMGIYQKTKDTLDGKTTSLNGEPALLLINKAGEVETILFFDLRNGKVGAFYFLRNPDKFPGLPLQ